MPLAKFLGPLIGAALALMVAVPGLAETAPQFAGSATCAGCHAEETAAWTPSDHAWALKVPDATSVLGDFNDASYTGKGVTTRFFRDGDAYMVETEGPDGMPAQYQYQSSRRMQGETCPDADARPIAKRQIGKTVDLLRARKTAGVERVRIGPQSVMAVQGVDRQNHCIALQDLTPAQTVLGLRRARQKRRRRIHPQRLIHDLARQGQLRNIRHGCRPVAQHGHSLGSGGGLHIRIEGAQIQRPGQRQRRRLMPGHDEGQQIVPQLCRGHLAARGRILPGQQQIQQVRHRMRTFQAALINRKVRHPFHLANPSTGKHPAQTWHPGRGADDIQKGHLGGLADIPFDGAMHRRAVKARTIRKGDIRYHLKGRGDHFGKHIDAAPQTRRQSCRRPLGGAGHHRGKRRHVAMGEHGSGGAALPLPMRALRHKQAFPDCRAKDQLGHNGFRIVFNLVAQNLPQRPRLHHHMPPLAGAARQNRCMRCNLGDQLQHIAPPGLQRAKHTKRLGGQRHTRGQSRCGHANSFTAHIGRARRPA